MAIVSESMLYQERIAPSYVSSSGYYGYVPPPSCPIVNYESVVKESSVRANEAINETFVGATTGSNQQWTIPTSSLIFHNHNNHNNNDDDDLIRKYDSAMETDDDETLLRSDESCVGVSRCQNNPCVIPEAAVQSANLGSERGRYESSYRITAEQPDIRDMTRRRGNRKRNSAGDPAYLIDDRSAIFTKKSRQDGGNGNFRNGTGSSGNPGSSTLHYEQTSLIDVENVENGTIERRCVDPQISRCRETTKAAGNYDSLDRTNHLELEREFTKTSESKEKLGDGYLDYEIMLMETHGCSAYHYDFYRHLDIAVSAEVTEF